MKTTISNIQWKNWKTTTTLLMLGLALSTLTTEVARAAKPPKGNPVPILNATADYPIGMIFSAPKLTYTAFGYSPGWQMLGGITWDTGTVSVDLSAFSPGYHLGRIDRVDIRYGKNAAGQIVSIKVEGLESIPTGGYSLRFHDTPWIPVPPVTIDPVNGYTIQVRADVPIPVFRHTHWKSTSPVEGIVGYLSLWDFVLTPRP